MRPLLFALLVFASSSLSAQQPPAAPAFPGAPAVPLLQQKANDAAATNASQKDLTGYYVIPEIPATTLLGSTPSTITRPATTKDLSIAILDGIDASGRVKQGFAIEASLGLLKPFQTSLENYQANARARIFSNLLLSLASARAAGDTGSTDVAWGIRVPLYDGGDPLSKSAWSERLGKAMLACAPKNAPGGIPMNTGQTQAQVEAEAKTLALEASGIGCLENAAEQIGKEAADSLWNATRLTLGYSGSTRFRQSKTEDRARIADRYWLVGSVPVSRITGLSGLRAMQAIGYLDYSHYRAIDTIKKASTAKAGARMNYGSANMNLFYEWLYESRSNLPINVKKNVSTWSFGVEFLATEGVWISTGMGKRAEDVFKPDKVVLLANVRWGIASKSFLKN